MLDVITLQMHENSKKLLLLRGETTTQSLTLLADLLRATQVWLSLRDWELSWVSQWIVGN